MKSFLPIIATLLLLFTVGGCSDDEQLLNTTNPSAAIATASGDSIVSNGPPLPQVRLTVDNLDKVTRSVSSHATIAIYAAGDTNTVADFTSDCMVHYRGATASEQAKKSFAVALVDSAGNAVDANVMGIRSDDKWILDAMAIDKARMRNRVCFDLWNEVSTLRSDRMVRNGTRGEFVELWLNDDYHGIYCLTDRVNRKLLGVRKLGGVDSTQVLRGVVYKCSRGDTPNHWLKQVPMVPAGDRWGDWDLEYPEGYGNNAAWAPLQRLVMITNRTETDSLYVASRLWDVFYEENVVDYCLFLQVCALVDNAMHNSFLSCEDQHNDMRLWITPWDLDGSLGRDGIGGSVNRPGWNWLVFQSTAPFRKFFDDHLPPLFNLVAERWRQLKDSSYSIENVYGLLDHYAERFVNSGAWARERARWNGSSVELPEDINEELDFIKAWYARNYDYLTSLYEDVPFYEEEPSLPTSIHTPTVK